MKRFSYTLSLVLLASLCFAQLSTLYAQQLNEAFKERVDLLRVKGAAASVVFPDGSVWSSAEGKYGTDDLETDLLYDIGSNTKTMVAATILLLSEEGKLKLTDTIYQHISPKTNVSYGITVEQLLRHESGLYNYTNNSDFLIDINSKWSQSIPIDDIFTKYLKAPTAAPGSSFDYSNTNFILLGLIIEAIEGKSLNVVFKERLFSPLNLEDSYLAFADTYTKTHLGTWLSNGTYFEEPGRSFMTSAWAAGAVIQTPEDLAMWAFRLYRGELLADSSYNKMVDTKPLSNTQSHGLALFQEVYKGKRYYGHGGTTLQNSEMQYSVDRDFSVATIVIEQNKASQANLIQNKLIDVVDRELQLLNINTPNDRVKASVHPNPATHQLTIVCNSTATASLYSPLGEQILEFVIDEKEHIDVAQLSAGVYTLRLSYENGQFSETKRVIIN